MAFVLKDRVKETTSTSGTGSITLLGAVQGFQGFSAIGDGNTTYYTIAGVAEWEVGIGTYSAGVLSRDTVLASSANGDKVAFSSGVKDVFCTLPASTPVLADNYPITGAINTSSPNGTVNVASLTANVSTTNGDLVLLPKGTGALLADIPDSASTGGDKRGTRAVDWQMTRSSSSQVASGLGSVIGGGSSNTASGSYSSVGGGLTNRAAGSYSYVGGGTFNTALGNYNVIAGGQSNADLTGVAYATIGGGYLNRAYGDYSFVGGGNQNIASVPGSAIAGGRYNATTGLYSFIGAGAYGTTRGVAGMHVFPACDAPIETKNGVSQAGLLVLGVETTDATPTVLCANSFTASIYNQLVLPNNSAMYFSARVVACVTGGGNSKSWNFSGLIKRGVGAASTTIVGSSGGGTHEDAGASAWDVALSADTTLGALAVTATGQASTTIRWVCKIETTEVTY